MRREAIHFYLKFHYRPVEGPMQSELQMPIEIGYGVSRNLSLLFQSNDKSMLVSIFKKEKKKLTRVHSDTNFVYILCTCHFLS